MELTQEQKRIIDSDQDLTVNAVAGSGKTTTIVEYARRRPNKRILYLAYNKSVRQHAQQLFMKHNLSHVTVETAHSLAFKYVVPNSVSRIRNSYHPSELAALLSIPVDNQEQEHLKTAYHVWGCFQYYCNHGESVLAQSGYNKYVSDRAARKFVDNNYDRILFYVDRLLKMMDRGEIDITHDYYLKKFQMMQPTLPFDLIMFDEGQDASPVMLDVFYKQNARRIIIGDTHQQIYGWRYAVNALDDDRFSQLSLSRSFRFGNDIARLARAILGLKSLFMQAPNTRLTGVDSHKQVETRAFIARTNAVLLSKAIDMAIHHDDIRNIYFEGGLASYIFSQSGTSIYDLVNLYDQRKTEIKDPMIMSMPSFDHLLQYAATTGDLSLKVISGLVKKYGNVLSVYIEKLKEISLHPDHRSKADITFTTVHKSKGMEYDEVFLGSDFVTEQMLMDRMPAVRGGLLNAATLSEEVNMLYVAVTRTKAKLHIPSELVPVGIETGRSQSVTTNMSFGNVLSSHAIGNVWSKLDDAELQQLFVSGKPIRQIALLLNRTPVAINERVEKLRLWDKL
jgi:superfamily I DNA/RNA helicase